MVCLGFKPGAAGWKAYTNPLSYDSTPTFISYFPTFCVPLFNKAQSQPHGFYWVINAHGPSSQPGPQQHDIL